MMPKVFSLSRLVLRSFAVAASVLLLQAPASLDAQSTRTPLATRTARSLPTLIDTGLVPASQHLSLTLTLTPLAARAAALDRYIADVTSPSSGSYHQWLTPAQFGARFGATTDQLSTLSAWARTQGLSVEGTSPSGLRVTVSGTAASVQAAFAVSLHTFQNGGSVYFANVAAPLLDPEAASMIAAIDGLDNLVLASSSTPFGSFAAGVDADASAVLTLAPDASSSESEVAEYTALTRQAAAQGISVLTASSWSMGLPNVTAVIDASSPASVPAASAARPGWQYAPGLPADSLRDIPDLTASTLSALAQTVASIAAKAGGHLGDITPVLYAIASEPGLFSQPDSAPGGTWEPSTGLGTVDLDALAKLYPRGTGQSFTGFRATNYSPVHGQGTSFYSAVTSGTGGPTPTGTVSFVTTGGTVLGTAPLVAGTATLTIASLDGGNYTLDAVYSGDGTYAPSTSDQAQLYVQPEASALSVVINGSPTVGGTYTLTVVDAAPSGVGQPSGPVTVTFSGTSNIYTQTLSPYGAGSSSATFTLPATTAGTLTFSVQCTTSPNYSCYNPYTTTVTIAKATPQLTISTVPTVPVSGAGITLNAVVSTIGTAPAPTGAVTFYDNGTTLNAGQLTNGSTTTTGVVPTTATHSITATYSGDPNYNSVSTTAGSNSSGTINTSLVLSSSASIVTAGTSITFTANVTPASTGPASPTGTVTFLDGTAQLGTVNLVGNQAMFTTASLSATVNHTISAVYSGDGYYSASTSNAVGLSFNSNSNTTTTTLIITPISAVHGNKVHFVVTVSGPTGAVTPTGTVTISNTAGVIGQVTLSGGTGTFSSLTIPGGTSTYTALYSGDSTYNPSTSNAQTFTIAPEPVTVTVTFPAAGKITFGTPFTVSIDVAGNSGVPFPTGTVILQPTGTGYSAAVTATLTNTGAADSFTNVVIPATGAGSISFTATYSGDRSFAAAGPVTSSTTVAKAQSTTTLTFTPTQPIIGQSTTLTARVASLGSVAPTGNVQFFNGTALLGTATLDATGTATFATVFNAANQIVTAVYSGDNNYIGSTSNAASTTVGTNPSVTSLVISPNVTTFGGSVALNVSVGTTVNGTVPTGTVQISGGGTIVCSIQLAAGSGTCPFTDNIQGAFVLTANYLGDSTYAPSSSTAQTITATYATGSISSTIAPASAPAGTIATVTTMVTAPAGTLPTGSILATITNAGGVTVSSSSVIISSLSNTFTVAIPVAVPAGAGAYTVTVSCSGTNFTCASNTLTLTSTGSTSTTRIATTTLLTAVASATTTGATVLTATVTPASAGTAALSGTVSFYDGTTQVGVAVAVASGVASQTVTLAGTTHSLTAIYSGDTLYAGSVSNIVTSISTTTTGTSTPAIVLTSSTSTGLAGSPVLLTVTVTGTGTATSYPTGTVSFYVAGTSPRLLGTQTLGQTGAHTAVAYLNTNLLTSGSQSIYAVYNGDTNFVTATSNTVTLGLTDYSVSFVPPSLTLTAGQTGQITAVVSVVNGFSGNIIFGCTPPANSLITCSVTPQTVAGGSNVNTTINVFSVAPRAVTSQQAGLERKGGLRAVGCISLAALMCCLLPGGRRRRIPALLLALMTLSLAANLGCSDSTLGKISNPGSPLGTYTLIVNTSGSDGVTSVRHDYPVQITIQ